MQHFREPSRSPLPERLGDPRSPARPFRSSCAVAIRLSLCLFSLMACVAVDAQQPAAPASEKTDWPSPDGKLAFLTSIDGEHGLAMVDRKSGKIVQRLDGEDSERETWHVLWAPNSNRFALMTRLGHPIQGLDVYVRGGAAFHKLDLPELPTANIPERLKHGKPFPHVANLNWQEARRWTKDGSLVVTIDTMIDGDGGSITATRTVVLDFDRAGKARIGKSTIKYETAKD
jgi:hypothetical protein